MNELPCRIVNLSKSIPSESAQTPSWMVVTDKGTFVTRHNSAVNFRINHQMAGTEVTFLMDGKIIAGLI